MNPVTLAVIEAEEAMLEVFALQWRTIDLRAKQLRNQCRQIELDEELDREERDLIHEHEHLLRMKEKQLAQQQCDDEVKISATAAAMRKLQAQTEQLQQRRESIVVIQQSTLATTVAAKATTKPTKAAAKPAAAAAKSSAAVVVKRKSKPAKSNSDASTVAKSALSTTNNSDTNAQVLPPKKTPKSTKNVTFSTNKPAAHVRDTAAHSTQPRRLEDSFNEDDNDANNDDNSTTALEDKPTTTTTKPAPARPSAAAELQRLLAADKSSDSEADGNTSLADLLFSPAASRPSANNNDATPSKLTPSKLLARKVAKKALAAPIEFDFTRKAALAKAKAVRERKQRQEAEEEKEKERVAEIDAATALEKPTKTALKRRKDLGISLSDRPVVTTAVTEAASSTATSGSQSLMDKVGAATLVRAKQSKAKDPSREAAPGIDSAIADAADEPPVAAKAKPQTKTKTATMDVNEPEAEDFARLEAANITKRGRGRTKKVPPAATTNTTDDPADPTAPARGADKPQARAKDKAPSGIAQAIAQADLLTRMTRMQDIATPQVPGKKSRKAAPSTSDGDAHADNAVPPARRAATNSDSDSNIDNNDDVVVDATRMETPRKVPTMKRKRAPLDATTAAAAPTTTTTGYMQSPSVTALLAMRPSKSPIGIRYVPKPLKTPQMSRKRSRTADDASERPEAAVAPAATGAAGRRTQHWAGAGVNATATTGAAASALWGNSSTSFFDAFVNGGAPRLKRSVVP